MAKPEVLIGFADDLAAKSPRLTTRVRGQLVTIHSVLDRATVRKPRRTRAADPARRPGRLAHRNY
ncbi:hypothetical protein GCM10022254_50560 [Actinomadura meridiana]|uniref:Uncharacterized protein n=1 Tax=Actinomadura meridiana TaxID=559626 RepID=A0ABP8CCZ8_9ACTN